MGKQMVVYPRDEILLRHKKENGTETFNDGDESQKKYAEWKKTDTNQ